MSKMHIRNWKQVVKERGIIIPILKERGIIIPILKERGIIIPILCLLFMPFIGLAQGQCNVWYFGAYAGLNFNTLPPTPLTNGQLNTNEGCTSISDVSGNLLFYTNGTVVFNKSHALMPNGTGLLGHQSSTQSSVVIPKPGTFNALAGYYNRYYIITSDYNQSFNGVRFSEVDMTLAGGLGDIVVATKNTLLYGGASTEKLAVATHANGCDYWLVGRPSSSTDFYSYHISAAGLNTTPVVTTIPGSAASPTLAAGIGSMKASPDNKYIALINGFSPAGAAFYQNGLFIYDFNNATGVLSPKFYHASSGSPLFPYAFTNSRLGYGVEFSPDSKLIYTTGLYSPSIQQYNLNVATNALFQSSRQNIGLTASPPDGNNYSACALQLAPDGKIYVALTGNDSLGVIASPNLIGNACNYQDVSVSLGGRGCILGLPSFVTGLIAPVKKIVLKDSCITSNVKLEISDTTKVLAYSWTLTPVTNTANVVATASGYSTTVNFPGTGQYLASVELSFKCYSYIISSVLNIGPPSFTVSAPAVCAGNMATLTANGLAGNYTYSWSPGLSATTGSVVTGNATSSQTYTVSAKDTKGCVTSATVGLVVNARPVVALSGIQHVACFGQNTGSMTVLPSGGAGTGYTVTPAATTALSAGTYTIAVTDANLCSTQTVVTITQPAAALTSSIVSTASVSCKGANTGQVAASSTGGTPAYAYVWQGNASTTGSATGYAAGTYTYHVADANNCVSATYSFVIAEPSASLTATGSQTNVLCHGQNNGSYALTASGGTPVYTYSWTGTSAATHSVSNLAAGNYTVTVRDNNNCATTQTFSITEPPALSTTITNTTQAGCGSANGAATLSTTGGTWPYVYLWNLPGGTSYTSTAASANNLPAGTTTVVVTDLNGCTENRFVSISNVTMPAVSSSVSPVSCFGGTNGIVTITVSGGTPSYSYLWNTGATTANLNAVPSGIYTLTVTDANSCMAAYTVSVAQPASALSLATTYSNSTTCYQAGAITASVSAAGGSPGYHYVWQPGNISGASVSNVAAGIYTITATDTKSCMVTTTLAIEAAYTPMALSLQQEVRPTCKAAAGSLELKLSGGAPAYSYLWNTGATSLSISGITEGAYHLVVSDSLNCTAEFDYTLQCHFEVFIPEYFSPNGDGKNDLFEIKFIDQYPHNKLSIYNRWGSAVYTKDGYANEWDGKPNASDATGTGLLPSGTYYVVLDFGAGDELKPYHGILQLQH